MSLSKIEGELELEVLVKMVDMKHLSRFNEKMISIRKKMLNVIFSCIFFNLGAYKLAFVVSKERF